MTRRGKAGFGRRFGLPVNLGLPGACSSEPADSSEDGSSSSPPPPGGTCIPFEGYLGCTTCLLGEPRTARNMAGQIPDAGVAKAEPPPRGDHQPQLEECPTAHDQGGCGECTAGACTCSSRAARGCRAHDVWSIGSRGTTRERVEDCAAGCAGGACLPAACARVAAPGGREMRFRTWLFAALLALPACGTRGGRTNEAGSTPAPVADAATSGGVPTSGAAAEHEGEGPTPAERRLLLALARAAIDRRLAGEPPPELDPSCVTPYLAKPLACFVTLNTSDGNLRGCIGMFAAQSPLWENVMDRARAAAFADGRFRPVREPELPDLVIDISILTAPRPFEYSSPEDLRDRLRPLVDGVTLHSPWGSSTFLPQVWEDLPDREEFLGHLCRKHGAPEGCWRDPELRVETYQAIVFSEHAHPPREEDWFALDASGRYRCTAPPVD